MAIGDQAEYDYMVRRTLGLLLTNARGDTPAGDVVDFGLERASRSHMFGRPVLPSLLYLMSLWLALKSLRESILPFLREVRAWEVTQAQLADGEQDGEIDWEETFTHWADGGEGIQTRRIRQVRAVEEARYVAAVLAEVRAHCEEIRPHIEAQDRRFSQPVMTMLADISAWQGELEAICQADWLQQERRTLARVGSQAADHFRTQIAEGPGSSGSLLERYRRESAGCVPSPPRRPAVVSAVRNLTEWRRLYLEGEVWLSDRAELQYRPDVQPAGLFELWCFMELIRAARASGASHVSQHAFLARKNLEAEFQVGDTHYAYFDLGCRRFRTASAGQVLAGARPALPRAHVEWFIRHRRDFSESLVMDTKYRRWRSGQALKVLGYMKNFGVSRGAIVFCEDLGGSRDAADCREGVLRFDCPGSGGGRLWALGMIPTPGAEERNTAAMTRLLLDAILDD